jgi:hypothetical protein
MYHFITLWIINLNIIYYCTFFDKVIFRELLLILNLFILLNSLYLTYVNPCYVMIFNNKITGINLYLINFIFHQIPIILFLYLHNNIKINIYSIWCSMLIILLYTYLFDVEKIYNIGLIEFNLLYLVSIIVRILP